LNAAKATLDALGCPFDQMDACEPAGNAQDSALLAELDRVRGQLNAARADINTLRADRDAALAGKASADKTVQRMIDGLALTASTYESNAGEGYSWIDAVASNAEAGPGLASVRANRGLMAMVSREQSIQIIPSDTSGLQGEVDALKAQVAALRGNLRDANDTNTGLRGQLNAALGQRDAVAVERDELMALLAGAADRASLLADERDAAAKLAEDRLAEILRLTTALTAQGEDLQALAGDFNSVESQRSGLQRDLEQALLVIDERDATIQSLTLNIETLSTDLGAATNQRDEAISDRDLLLEEIAKLDHTVETLLAKNRELQALMDDLSAEAAQDRTAATEASAAMDTLRIELDQRTEGLAAAQDRSGLLERELAELRVILSQIDGELTDARNSSTAVSEENNSLVVVLQELREDIIAKDQAAQDASSQISTLTVRINELEAAGLENEAFFDILITQCTALLGLEGDGGDALDRETLAYECAAAFESAQRWRADLTEMLELRDRSLQACEARYAALDTRAKTLAAGVCGE
jgi:chromosome segregation ATPase